jgi:predicted dehydrogenase
LIFSVLIIGLGQIGMGYDLDLDLAHIYSHSRAFNQHDKFTLIGGVDPQEVNRKKFEQIYECPAYSTIDEALSHHQPNIVVISVPTALHGDVLLQVLNNTTPELILCEKPLSYRIEEAALMVEACKEKDVLLYVNYMRRCDPGVLEIKRRLDMNEIEKPIKGVAWYSKGFIHNGSHFLNLLEFWLGPYQHSTIINEGRSYGQNDKEPDVHVLFEQGAIFFLAAWEESFSHYTLELLSPSGRLRYEKEGQEILWEQAQKDPFFNGYQVLGPAEKIDSGMRRYQLQVVEQLANVLEGKRAFLCSGFDALQTLTTIQHILR